MALGRLIKNLIDQLNTSQPGTAGNDGGTGSALGSPLEKFLVNGGAPLALAFGLQKVVGQLFYNKYLPGPPPSHRFIIGNGEGLGVGWEGPQLVSWAGLTLNAVDAADGTTPGYHFKRGRYSSGPDDEEQGIDSYLPAHALTYSGTCITIVKLPEDFAVEETPGKLRQIMKCMRVPDFNHTGVMLNAGLENQFTYSNNPARVLAFAFWRLGLLHRINWPSWYRFKLWCDELIEWEGDMIKRFEANPVWLTSVTIPQMLDTISLVTGAIWQDDHDFISFLLPTDLDPVHHFSAKNTVEIKVVPVSLEKLINRLTLRFRDTGDQYLAESTVTVDRELSMAEYGLNAQEITVPNMHWSMAQRLCEMMMRIIHDNPNRVTAEGGPDSLHILEGDVVTADVDINGTEAEKYRVLGMTDINPFSRADVRRFDLQRLDTGILYSDKDHGARPVVPEDE